MSQTLRFQQLSGHAVIGGTMLRSMRFVVLGVRQPDNKMHLRSIRYTSWLKKDSWLNTPLIRPVIFFLESVFWGVETFIFSNSRESDAISVKTLLPILLSFGAGVGLFVVLPKLLTQDLMQNPAYHLVNGALRILTLTVFLTIVSRLPVIKELFQNEAAHRKVLEAFLDGKDLQVESVRSPSLSRVGMSATLLFSFFLTILLFSAIAPVFQKLSPLLNVLIKILLVPIVVGFAIAWTDQVQERGAFGRFFLWPHVVIQKLLSQNPADHQIETALASFVQLARLEKGLDQADSKTEIEITNLGELGRVLIRPSDLNHVW